MVTTARCIRCDQFKSLDESRVIPTVPITPPELDFVPNKERVCYSCQPDARGDWRVIRRLNESSDDETAGMAYCNIGPYPTREAALEARASMIAAEAISALKRDSHLYAANLLFALVARYHASDAINVGAVAYDVFQL